MKAPNFYKNTLKLLEELHRKYPTQTLGQHIATAFAEYPDLWPISHKEFYYALEKYSAELEIGGGAIDSAYIDKIIEDGKNLLNTDYEKEDEEDREFEY